MKYNFDEIVAAKDVIGVFYLYLVLFPFDKHREDIVRCRKALKQFIIFLSGRCEKYANLCRIYDLYLRLQEIKFKKKKLWHQLNTCNYLMKWIDYFYRGDVDN